MGGGEVGAVIKALDGACSSSYIGGGARGFAADRFGVDEPERDVVEEDLEGSENCFLAFLGRRTHPSRLTESSGALLDRVCFLASSDGVEDFLTCRLCDARLCGLGETGTKARDERDRRYDSWEKVLIASIREAFDKVSSA